MIEVFWTPILYNDIKEHYVSELNYFEPERLSKNIDNKKYFGPFLSQCPSVIDELKNTFVVKSPIKFNATYDNINLKVSSTMSTLSPKFIADYLDEPNPFGVHQVKYPDFLFFCNQDGLTMTQLPAYYHENGYTNNVLGLSGSFDISNWARPVRPAFKFRKKCNTIDVEIGDEMCYYKFNTDEKVKLVRFDGSKLYDPIDNSRSIFINCVAYKTHSYKEYVPKTLIDCYNSFKRGHYRKRMMKYIDEHRLD